jgi:hypothetical protein
MCNAAAKPESLEQTSIFSTELQDEATRGVVDVGRRTAPLSTGRQNNPRDRFSLLIVISEHNTDARLECFLKSGLYFVHLILSG